MIPEPTGTTVVATNAGYTKLFTELGLGSLAVGIIAPTSFLTPRDRQCEGKWSHGAVLWGKWRNGVKSQHLTFIPSNSSAVLIEKLTYFPQHFAEFRCLHFSDRVKNEVVFNGEKSFSSDGEPR